jgi:NADH-quinone oxidoreductase subunit A
MSGVSVLSPLIALPLLLMAVLGCSLALSRLVWRKGGRRERQTLPYACGEEARSQMIQPDYSQFLPFAFFFTILHVVALMVATVPVETPTVFVIAAVYVLAAGVGLSILYRR